ncbi:hypothetical protein SFC76_05420 [Sphingomonas sp. CD22]|uniref:hypothetical protein n=1 Tax=Sphingomonas sp. CD22 TaxID=3100214 RepID=UPI002ADF1275|nr:hypothetical protein [Sphingomonas sp. CD22]MEA1083693.1 hypothetical protein [Sphingomonas sp. CD22]
MSIRIAKYVALLFASMMLLAGVASLINPAAAAQNRAVRSGVQHKILNLLLISPVVESLIVLLVYRILFRNGAGRSRTIGFVALISIIAFMSHGADLGALFPALMFAAGSTFMLRTVQIHGQNAVQGFIGMLAIHLCYNAAYLLVPA